MPDAEYELLGSAVTTATPLGCDAQALERVCNLTSITPSFAKDNSSVSLAINTTVAHNLALRA